MRKFDMPEIEVVNVSETANGILPGWREAGWGWFGHHDSFAGCGGNNNNNNNNDDDGYGVDKDLVNAES